MKRGGVGPRAPGVTSLSSNAGTEVGRRRPTFFDDQRTGWDFTSSDLGKFRLTEEQVKVSVVVVRITVTRKHAFVESRDGHRVHRRPAVVEIFEFIGRFEL